MAQKCEEHSGICNALTTIQQNNAEQYARIHSLETKGCAVGASIKETLLKLDGKIDRLTLAVFATLGSMIVGLILLVLKK